MKLFRLLLTILLLCIASYHPADAATKQHVTFLNSVDGDTLKVMNSKGQTLTLRLLLIDTPESKKPNTPVQPYSKEAAAYLTNLVKNGDLTIQYDNGGKTDRYGRQLVYLYRNGKMVNEQLVYNGYARVGYIYSQKMYLQKLLSAQNHAKNNHLRIWKKPGYVNANGEGFITSPTKTVAKTPVKKPVVSSTSTASSYIPASTRATNAPLKLANCTEVKQYYPYGITSRHPSYEHRFDRDGDGVGCDR